MSSGPEIKYAVKFKVGADYSIGIFDDSSSLREQINHLEIGGQLLGSSDFKFRMSGTRTAKQACQIIILHNSKVYFWDWTSQAREPQFSITSPVPGAVDFRTTRNSDKIMTFFTPSSIVAVSIFEANKKVIEATGLTNVPGFDLCFQTGVNPFRVLMMYNDGGLVRSQEFNQDTGFQNKFYVSYGNTDIVDCMNSS